MCVRVVVTRHRRFDLDELNLDIPTGAGVYAYQLGDANPRAQLVGTSGEARYRRPSSDVIDVDVTASSAGTLLIREAHDPGWRATVDGAAAPVQSANDVFMGIPISSGQHKVRLAYHTPGAVTGLILSALGIIGLAVASFTGISRWRKDESDDAGER